MPWPKIQMLWILTVKEFFISRSHYFCTGQAYCIKRSMLLLISFYHFITTPIKYNYLPNQMQLSGLKYQKDACLSLYRLTVSLAQIHFHNYLCGLFWTSVLNIIASGCSHHKLSTFPNFGKLIMDQQPRY